MSGIELFFAGVGGTTPFILAGYAAWRALNKSFNDMREEVAASRAEQDTRLDHHEKRLDRIEDIVF